MELKPGTPTESLSLGLKDIRIALEGCSHAFTWENGRDTYIRNIERFDAQMHSSFVDDGWSERLYSESYWRIREMSEDAVRPLPILEAESMRVVRWIEVIERDLKRVESEDEWDQDGFARVIFDTSALVREGEFDRYDWKTLFRVKPNAVRLIIPILVIRELDDLKNRGSTPKARARLRRIYEILGDQGRGPATVSDGVSWELLLDPHGHFRFHNHDEEIVRRAVYLQGRRGGPLKLVSGDYTMLSTARVDGLDAVLTPSELLVESEE